MAQQVSAARDTLISLHILFWIKFWMLYIQKPFTVARFFLTLYLVIWLPYGTVTHIFKKLDLGDIFFQFFTKLNFVLPYELAIHS